MRRCPRCRRTTIGEEPTCVVCDGETVPVDPSALARRRRRLLTVATLVAATVIAAGVAVGSWVSVTAPAAASYPAPQTVPTPAGPDALAQAATATSAPTSAAATPPPAPVSSPGAAPPTAPQLSSPLPPAAPPLPAVSGSGRTLTCPAGAVALTATPSVTGATPTGPQQGAHRRVWVTLAVVNDTTAPVDHVLVRVQSADRLFTFAFTGPLPPGATARQTYGGYPLHRTETDPETAAVLTADLSWADPAYLGCDPPRTR